MYNTWIAECEGKDIEIIEKDFDHDCHQYEVYVNGEFIGSICPGSVKDSDDCRNQLNENGALCVLEWEDGAMHGVSFDKDSDFAEFWRAQRR